MRRKSMHLAREFDVYVDQDYVYKCRTSRSPLIRQRPIVQAFNYLHVCLFSLCDYIDFLWTGRRNVAEAETSMALVSDTATMF